MLKKISKNSNKILTAIAITGYLSIAISLPFLNALAAGNPQDSPVKGIDDVIRILNNIVNLIYIIFFIIATFFILISAFKFLTAQNDPKNIESAKNGLLYAVIAIIIAFLSFSFGIIIKNFLS